MYDYSDPPDYDVSWSPSPAQFAEYLRREREMAPANFAMGTGTTLHTLDTLRAAGCIRARSRREMASTLLPRDSGSGARAQAEVHRAVLNDLVARDIGARS